MQSDQHLCSVLTEFLHLSCRVLCRVFTLVLFGHLGTTGFLNHSWQSWGKWLSNLVRLDLKKTHYWPKPELAFLLGCAWVEKKIVFLNHSEMIVEVPLGPRGPFYIPSHRAGHQTPCQVWTWKCRTPGGHPPKPLPFCGVTWLWLKWVARTSQETATRWSSPRKALERQALGLLPGRKG